MILFDEFNISYWKQQADKLITDLESGKINSNDIARGLECTYCAGVIDAALFNEEQKKDMYEALKEAYGLGEMAN